MEEEEAFLRSWLRPPSSIISLALILLLLLLSSSCIWVDSLPQGGGQLSYDGGCPNTNQQEVQVLRKLYTNVDPPAAQRRSGCVCHWEGVTCDPESGVVTELKLSNRSLAGSIPPDLSQLAGLTAMDLSLNSFNGSIPLELRSLTQLRSLNLSWNNLTDIPPGLWSSPAESGGRTSSSPTDQSWGYYSGEGPSPYVPPVSSLETLDLSHNEFNATALQDVGALTSLQRLNLGANQLGVVGDQGADQWALLNSLVKCQRLQELDLSGNGFHEQLPHSLLKLSSTLKTLDVSRNNLMGTIPNQLFALPSLYVRLNLSRNGFTGILPDNVGNLVDLVALDVSHNLLSGEIPPSLGNCTKLELVHLENNRFSGNISSGSFNELQPIRELNLSCNNLSGTIPSFFACFSNLSLLDVSHNDFEGAVPIGGIFRDLDKSSFDGNSRLRADEKQPPNACLRGAGTPTVDSPIGAKSKSGLPKPALPAIIVGAIFILLILLLFLLYKYKCFANESSGGLYKAIPIPKASLRVTYASLQAATEGFSHGSLIGAGGTGCVYRGSLRHEHKAVAVKVLDREVLGDLRSFKEECNKMRSIEHANLVKLLASFAGVDANGDQFRALVYELMPNGNLEMWLREEVVVSQLQPSKKWNLSLYQRLNIAIDVASALVHLHCELKKPIVHCNLKPSNILLAADMTARVTDFGMNRFFRIDKVVMRSAGYIAPELAAGSPISPSWDVYSFGIILLEMFTGRRPTDEHLNASGNPDLHGYVLQRYPLDIEAIIDPLLLSEETGGKLTDRARSCVTSIIHTALICSEELPETRIEMREALEKLEHAKLALLDAGSNGTTVYESSDHGWSSDGILA